MNKEIIKDFWKYYNWINNCSLQTFDDVKWRWDKTLAWIYPMSEIKKMEELEKKWAWIFFSVNPMKLWKRNKEDTTEIKTWIVENDNETKENQMTKIISWPIYPTMIIESKNSLHCYFFAKDWTKENYKKITQWLQEYYNWDVKLVWDYSRVLRFPWFNHQKNLNEKFEVNLIDYSDVSYTEKEMMEKYPVKEKIKKEYKKTNDVNYWQDIDWLANWNTKEMLLDLSGTWLVNWESIEFTKNSNWTEQIKVNWNSTWCWLDHQWLIWSQEWWPTWIQWLMYYKNITKSELLKYCWEHYKDRMKKLNLKREIKKEIKKEEIKKEIIQEDINNNFKVITREEKIIRAKEELINTDPKKIIKWGWKQWDGMLGWIYWWKIYVVWAETWIWKTTFVNQVCYNVSKQWRKIMKYSLEDRIEDIGKEEIYFMCNRLRKKDWLNGYQRTKFVNNEIWGNEFIKYVNKAVEELIKDVNIKELDKTKQVNIDELVILMEREAKEWVKMFVIDHLHYFDMKESKERHDLQIQSIMHRINEIARKYNVAVILVAHYKWIKKEEQQNPNPSYFKDWSAIKQVGNILIQITRDTEEEWDNISYFHITKLRWPIRPRVLEAEFDLKNYEYTFEKTQEQLDKDRWI